VTKQINATISLWRRLLSAQSRCAFHYVRLIAFMRDGKWPSFSRLMHFMRPKKVFVYY